MQKSRGGAVYWTKVSRRVLSRMDFSSEMRRHILGARGWASQRRTAPADLDEVAKYFCDLLRILDQCNQFHLRSALREDQRIDRGAQPS